MEQQQQREWCELRSQTWQHLRQREHILRSKHRPLLQYLVMPSFTDTWCIDFVRSGDTRAAYRTVWRVTQDIEAFATALERLKHPRPFVPTLESTLLDASDDTIESVMRRLGCMAVPLKDIHNSISVDGTIHELQIADGRTELMLQWHNHLPNAWPSELHDVLSDLDAMEYQPAGQASTQPDERKPE